MASNTCHLLFGSSLLLCGALRAQLDYAPTLAEVVLNTDSTQIQPTQGPPITVNGGVFVFRNVTINQGVRVRGTGSRPMIWFVTGTFVVNGELSVDGGDGERVDTLDSANIPALGGRGGAGAGNGGNGSPSAILRDAAGADGFGPGQLANVGGGGGLLGCVAGHLRGSAGGGGSFGTEGDPFYPVLAGTGSIFQQQRGIGGQGGGGRSGSAQRVLGGGRAGLRPFLDGRDDNDFFGIGYDVFRQRVIVGELSLPTGGQGGGGGGDLSFNSSCVLTDPNFANDAKGGGGGGGGGCLIVYAAGPIVVGGRITANGGHGGGGEQVGSCNEGGGGGGGSGGHIILASETAIGLDVKGETYANNDYDFVLSADGGVCTTGSFWFPVIASKYPRSGTAVPAAFGTTYDAEPLGGFGGLGVIQLHAPVGNNADGTNTILDDGILVTRNGNLLAGAQKQRFLGWRGYPNAAGVLVDDRGNPIPSGRTEGDIRPAPRLIPLIR